MVREVIKPDNRHLIIDIPDSYVGREIEVIISPLDKKVNQTNKSESITESLFGILKGKNIKEDDYKRYLEDKYL